MLYYGVIVGVAAIGVMWWRWIAPVLRKRREQRESLARTQQEKIERQRCRAIFMEDIAPRIPINQRPDRAYEPISFVALVDQLEARPEVESGRIDTVQLQRAIDWAIQFSYLRRSGPGYYVPGPKLSELRKTKDT